MITLAWILVALPVAIGLYAYALYPFILKVLARNTPTPAWELPDPAPLVTMVVPAYNEQRQIRGAIEALLAQSYPADRRQILIISDASNDGTDDIVREYADRGVELLRLPQRSGKTAAENASIPIIRGEIIVNSDSSVRLHRDAVRALVSAMSDPAVGVASSRDLSMTEAEGANPAEAGYVGYEMGIRSLETRTGGIVGASGSGYAIRSELHRHPVRQDLSRDFSAALTAERHGYQAVSVDGAICFVPRTASLSREYRRKVRTIARGMDTLYLNRDLLNPFTHGLFAWKLVSHKLARWMVPLSAIGALAGVVILSVEYWWARILLGGALLLALLAILGARWPDDRSVPKFLPVSILGALSANLAVVHAAWRFFHGHQDHIWEPTRRESKTSETAAAR